MFMDAKKKIYSNTTNKDLSQYFLDKNNTFESQCTVVCNTYSTCSAMAASFQFKCPPTMDKYRTRD